MSTRNRNISTISRSRQKGTKRPDVLKDEVDEKILKTQVTQVKADVRFCFLFTFVMLFGSLHSYHIACLFENDRHFSHLSSLEREMTFRTEMGLYYSYYKLVVEAPTFMDGLQRIMNDNLTEYPTTINALQRFNVYPEVVLGGLFRLYLAASDYFKFKVKECWMVDRGNLGPIESCDGYGDPAIFYVGGVCMWSALTVSVILLYGGLLSGSMLGGLFSVVGFFYNHSESTRVQWTPPLRESFAYPMCVAQMYAISRTIRCPEQKTSNFLSVSLLTALYMLPWQFAQFTLFTQTIAVMCLYSVKIITKEKCMEILLAQGVGMTITWCFLMGNKMLIMSVFNLSLTSSLIVVSLSSYFVIIKSRILSAVTQMSLLAMLMIALKCILPQTSDDDHIWNLLRSKFSSYKDFHTMLYTCAPEFDFLEYRTFLKINDSLLFPVSMIVSAVVFVQILTELYCSCNGEEHSIKPESPVLAYNLLQLGAFTAMAVVIMRLKLFYTPHLCIMSSLAFSERVVKAFKWREAYAGLLLGVLMIMSYKGLFNLDQQWKVRGEYNNPQLEQLIHWVNTNTPHDAVFAGTMPTMANLMLSTRRPIVNHPHYENSGARERNKKVYTLFSSKPVVEVHRILRDMGVQYAVVEESYCYRTRKEYCSMVDIWDVEDQENRGKTAACEKLYSTPSQLFKQMFRNLVYTVYKVLP